jgi:hypothetical protein
MKILRRKARSENKIVEPVSEIIFVLELAFLSLDVYIRGTLGFLDIGVAERWEVKRD